jgi:hypothetical protein
LEKIDKVINEKFEIVEGIMNKVNDVNEKKKNVDGN